MNPFLRFVAMSSNVVLFTIIAVVAYNIGLPEFSSFAPEELMVIALFFTGPLLSQYLVWSVGSTNRQEAKLRQRIKNTRLQQELEKLEKHHPVL